MKSSTKHLRLFMIALFTCIACVCLVFGVTACSSGKSSGSIDLDETSVTISVGETHTITATATEKDGGEYTGNYVWSCDGDAITITSDGNTCIMTGVSAGKASITVTAGSYSVRCDVTVIDSSTSSGTKNVETVSIEPDTLKLYVGQSGTVSASLTVTGGTTYTGDYEWESSDTAVATVTKGENGSCTVTAVGAGTATITVTVGAEGAKKQADCTVTVKEDSIATLELSEEAIVVAEEGTSTLIVTVKMTSGESSTDFEAEIEDDSIATIEVSGNVITVTGVETGETKITVTAGSITKECTVTVKEPEIAEINLSKTSVTLGTNETATITVTVTLDNGKTTDEYSASASCEPEDIVTANVANGILTITAGETEGGVKITVTIDGTTISAECSVTVADVQKEYSFDFSDPDTYAWIGTPDTSGVDESGESFMYLQNLSSTYTTGILTYVASGASVNKENAGALFTNTSSGTYFEIDLSAFEGFYVSIIVKMSTNSDTTARSLYINTDKSTSSGLKSVTSSNKTDYQTLEYGKVISAGETLYLTWSGNIRIFTIDIEIQDASEIVPEVQNVTISPSTLTLAEGETGTLTATVTMNIGDYDGEYEWMLSDGGVIDMTWDGSVATITAVATGTVTVTVKAGGKEAMCTVTVKEDGTASQEESFIVPIAGSEEGLSSDSFSSGSAITDNSLFIVTADIAMKYYGGSTGSSSSLGSGVKYGALQDGSNAVSFTDMSGTTHNPDQGIQVSSGIAAGETVDSILTVTAKEDIHLYLYVSWANDGYSSNKSGTIFCSVDGGEKVENALTARKTVWTISVELSAGQTLVVGATNNESSDSAKLWFFGAEAKLLDGTTGGGSSSGDFEEKEGYEWVKTEFDYASAMAQLGTTVTAENNTFGIFSFDANITMEASDIKTGGNRGFYIQLQGDTNYISFTATGASSSASSVITITNTATGAAYEWTTLSGENSLANNVSCDYTISGLPAGKYEIHTSVSAKISNLIVYQYREKGTPESITAVAGVCDFLFGRNVGETDLKLNVTLNYTNGNSDALTMGQYTTDAENKTWTVGENTVKITYSPEDGSQPFECDIIVYFYQLESVEISDFSMEKTGSNYITHNVQKVYLVGDEISYDYAAVTATAAYKDNDNTTHTATFVLTSAEVNFALYDENNNGNVAALAQAGTYTVRATVDMGLVSGSTVSETYIIHVIDASGADITTVNVIHPTENSNGTESETATYAPDTTTGIISVSTITDAIQLIKLMGATDAERKYIYVGEGQYWEKIYIDIPNLSLIGSNSSETDDLATRQETTEIVYWAYNGLMDPSGTTTFSTVGSATVTVANTATDFYAANITFRNYWNTNELYGECRTYTSDTQADAAYINADRAHFYNVTFTGYHDTLEAEKGRQYYDHCYIEGRTDYIFGDTATCYFKDCTIHTIGADSSSNGGYVTAVKGGSMTYGYVFDGCNFTSDLKSYYTTGGGSQAVPYEGFAYTEEGTVSLGRTWNSSNMHVAVINSTLDAGYSKTAYGTSGKNPRYTDMSGYAPTPAYLVEYNNSGAGSITEDLTNTCSILTAEQAANYTITNIFAEENGGISYSGSWDPSSEKTITVTVKDSTGADITKIYATNSITVSNLMNAVNARLTDAEVEALYDESGNEITETISDSTTVYIATKEPDSAIKENLYYEYSDFAALTTSGDGTYSLGGITIDLGASGAFYSNNDDKWYVLTGTTTFTLQVKAGTFIDWWAYQDSTLTLKVNGTETLFTSTDTTSECLYTYRAAEDATIEIGVVESKTAYIKYIAVNMMFGEGTTDLVSGWPDANYAIQSTVGYYYGMKVDATGDQAKLSYNSSDWLQINQNTTLTFSVPDGATVTATFYNQNTDGATYYSIGDVTGGFCTISVLANTYISAISIIVAG